MHSGRVRWTQILSDLQFFINPLKISRHDIFRIVTRILNAPVPKGFHPSPRIARDLPFSVTQLTKNSSFCSSTLTSCRWVIAAKTGTVSTRFRRIRFYTRTKKAPCAFRRFSVSTRSRHMGELCHNSFSNLPFGDVFKSTTVGSPFFWDWVHELPLV